MPITPPHFLTLFALFCLSTTLLALDWTPVDNIINNYINNAAFPGAVLRIANKTHTLYGNEYGKVNREIGQFGARNMTADTIFDIASLSKVTGTLAVIMQLVDMGLIATEDKVIKYIPEYNNHDK